MKLKAENGNVQFLMKAGKDLVHGIMSEAAAESIVKSGYEVTKSDNLDFPLCVDDKWFFPTLTERKKAKSVVEESEIQQEGE